MSDPSTVQHDHDLLIEIRTKLEALIALLANAQIPSRCAIHEQKHLSHESRIKTLETRFWWAVSLVIVAFVSSLAGMIWKGH